MLAREHTERRFGEAGELVAPRKGEPPPPPPPPPFKRPPPTWSEHYERESEPETGTEPQPEQADSALEDREPRSRGVT